MTTRLSVQDLLTDTQYAIRVRAVGVTGVSEWSTRRTFTTISDSVLPAVPTGVTWVTAGDAFHGEWNAVTTNEDGDTIPITRYEVELVGNSSVRIVSVSPATGSKVTYDLSFESNVALFGTPTPSVTLRVRAVDNKELKSEWSAPITATNPPPTPVTNLVGKSLQDAIEASWSPVTDDDLLRYDVFVGTSSGFVPADGNRIFSGLGTRVTYQTTTYSSHYFKVRSVDKFNQSSTVVTSSAVSPTSPFVVDSTAPATPTGLTASITNNANGIGSRAALNWTMNSAPSDLAGFYVRYRRVGDTSWANVTFQKDDRAGTVELQLAYTNYEFQIKAYDWSNNESAWSSTVTATSPANTAPANVTGLVASAGKDAIDYRWNAVADQDIKNYEVTFSTSSTFASGNITYKTGTSTTLTVGGLDAGSTYYARVRAVDTAGLTSVAWSSTVSATTGNFPQTPLSDGNAPASSPTPTVSSGIGYLYVTWAAVSNADPVTYDVHLSTTTGFTPSPSTKVTEVSGTFALVDVLPGTSTPLAYGTTYYIKLVARDRDGAAAAGTQASGQISKVASADSSLTAGDVGAPSTTDFNNLSTKVDDSVKTYSVEYAVNTSETTAPTTGWSTATPTRNPGDFIWTRTVITYQDNTTSTTNPALLTGNTGATGSQGIQGPAGADGTSLFTWLKYADTPTTGMSDDPTGKTYIGLAYNKTTATESTAYADYQWSLIKGADGATGKGVSSTAVTYQTGTSGTTAPTGTWSANPTATTTGQYLWTRTITTYTDSTTSTAYSVAAHGATGATGQTGPAGSDGVGITGTEIRYQKSTNGTTAPTGTWSTTIPATVTGEYLWTRTVTNFSDATSTTAYSVSAHGATGDTGATGPTGAAGRGISGTVVNYAKSTDGTTAPTTGWGTAIPTTVAGEYLWTRTVTSYTDSTETTAYSVAAHGATGPDGQDGADGRGISGTAVTYQKSTSGTTAPTGTWTTTIPSTTTGEYLWTRTITTYTDASTTTAYSVAAHGATGPQGPQGNQGIQGPAGADGQPTYTWIKYGTDANGAGLSDDPAGKTYIGIAYNKLTQTESTTAADYTWSLIQGPQGSTGATGTSVTAITPFYAQVATSAAAPTQPTNQATPPSPWVSTEPAYAADTKLYRTDRITYSNSTYAYTTVTLVSSYTAAVEAMTTANSKNTVYTSTAAPTNQANKAGDIWFVRNATTKAITGQYEGLGGTSWQQVTLTNGVIANLDAGVITAGSTFTQDLNVKSIFTLGDSTTPGIIKSYNHNTTNKTGFSLSSSGLEIWQGKVSAAVLEAGTTITSNLGVTGVLTISSAGATQSSNYVANTSGYKLDASGLEINNGSIKADAVKAGTLGGVGGSGVINIGAGTSLVLNGGYLKSNTYTGTAYNTSATAGFYLGHDGLRIAQGSVSAAALDAGVITGAKTIELSGASAVIQSQGYNGTAGFKLSGNGLEIPDGSLSAKKVIISAGNNLLDARWASVETSVMGYTSVNAATLSFDTTNKWQGEQALRVSYSGTESGRGFAFSPVNEKTVVEVGKTYLLSAWARNNTTTARTVSFGYINSSNVYGVAGIVNNQVSVPSSTGGWTRVYATLTVPSGVTSIVPYIIIPSGNFDVTFDALQIEERFGNDSPGPWVLQGITRIDGGMIRTGEIRSTNNTTINGVTEPVWSIPLNGAATFSAMRVLGNTVLGNGATDTTSMLSSSNYSPGSNGWRIRADGFAEFDSASIRGGFDASKITSGIINTDRLGADSITVNQLRLTDINNYVQDPRMKDIGAWSVGEYSYVTVSGTSPEGTNRVLRHNKLNNGAGKAFVQVEHLPVSSLDTLLLKCYVRHQQTAPTAGTVRLYVQFFDGNGAYITGYTPVGCALGAVTLDQLGGFQQLKGKVLPANIPSNAVSARVVGQVDGTVDAGLYDFTDVDCYKAISGDLLVDGAIDGKTINGVTLTGSSIQTPPATGGWRAVLESNIISLRNTTGWESEGFQLTADANGTVFNTQFTSGLAPLILTMTMGTSVPSGGLYARGTRFNSVVDATGFNASTNDLFTADQWYLGGSSGATINDKGRIIRTGSSRALKENITPMTLTQASKVLDMQPVTFTWKDTEEMGTDLTPGFVAEDAEAAGASLFVTHDREGVPTGIRYAEITSAHNIIIKEQQAKIDALEARLAAIEAHLGL